MNITLNQYIANPTQNEGRVYSAAMRDTQRINYTNRFNNVLMREGGQLTYYKYYDAKNNTYYMHIKVPSEPIKKFYYDVVFKFYADAKVEDAGRDLGKYYVQFFSNDPNFMFTYAHTFNKLGIFVKELTDKMAKKAIKDAAKVTNPKDQVGYIKSIYFAYLYMKERGLLNTGAWGDAINYSKEALSRNVAHTDEKVSERIELGARLERSKHNAREIKNPETTGKTIDPVFGVVNTKKTKTTNKVKTTNTIKGTRKSTK